MNDVSVSIIRIRPRYQKYYKMYTVFYEVQIAHLLPFVAEIHIPQALIFKLFYVLIKHFIFIIQIYWTRISENIQW